MTGWYVASILYLIPCLVSMLPHPTGARTPYWWETVLWPPFMLIGAIILYSQSRKKP